MTGLWLLGLLPILVGFALAGTRDPARAWGVAVGVGAAVLAASLGLAGWMWVSGGDGTVHDTWIPAFGVDRLSVGLLPFVAGLGLATLAMRPPSARTPRHLGAHLVTDGALLLLFLSTSLDALVPAWIASFGGALGRRHEPGVSRRPLVFALVASSAPLVAAWALLAAAGAPRDLAALDGAALTPGVRAVVYGLVVLAAAVRTGVFPFKTWQLSAISRTALGVPLVLVAARPGAFLLLRVAEPLAPALHDAASPIGAALGVFTALYGGLLGLAQRDLRRVLGALAVSHSGLIFAGLFSPNAIGLAGVRVQWINVGLALVGLALVVQALEARVGREGLDRARGLLSRLPGLATAWLHFGVCAVGFPGTPGFVGEDLLVQGLWEVSPALAVGALVATGLNGIVLMMAFYRVFLGAPTVEARSAMRLQSRERRVLAPLLLLLMALGLAPGHFVAVRAPAVADMPVRH